MYGSSEGRSLPEIFRQPDQSPEAKQRAVEDRLRDASDQMVNATLPRDVHHRYAMIRSTELDAISQAAEDILHTLKAADPGDNVLSGKVAEKVKSGIADLTSHHGYTQAAGSIT